MMNQYIEGIFNYCDRWCERCAFTSRCRSFAFENKLMEASNEDNKNKDAILKLFESFFDEIFPEEDSPDFFEVLQPEEISEFNWSDISENKSENKAKESCLFKATQAYANDTYKWVDLYQNELICHETDGKKSVTEAVEVIRRYAFFISAKLLRAINNDDISEIAVNSDENGSAKVALISINRSIAAWCIIRSTFKGDKHMSAKLIGQLISIRRAAEQAFPRAMEFIRPGFDTE